MATTANRSQAPGERRPLCRRSHGIEEQPRRGECGDHRVQDAQTDEDAGGRVEIACQAFGQRAGREEGVAQRGDGSADAENHDERETDGGHPRRASADSGGSRVCGPPGGQRQTRQQREGIQKMSGLRVGPRGGLIACDVFQQHEGGTEKGFGKQKDSGK